jgi:hypothetical protein
MSLPADSQTILYPVVAIIVAAAGIVVAILKGFGALEGKVKGWQKDLLESKSFRDVSIETSIEALRTDEGQATIEKATKRALDAERIVSRVDEALKTAAAAHRRLDDHLEKSHGGAA